MKSKMIEDKLFLYLSESKFKLLNLKYCQLFNTNKIKNINMNNYKSLIVFFLFLTGFLNSGCGNTGSTDSLDWHTNLEEAIQIAQAENKTILVNFTGSDWCQWCKKLSAEVFTQSDFEKYANENLVLVRLDFPRAIEQTVETKMYNNNLAQRFGVRGFPTIILLNSSGNLINTTGYQPGGGAAYVQHLRSLIGS